MNKSEEDRSLFTGRIFIFLILLVLLFLFFFLDLFLGSLTIPAGQVLRAFFLPSEVDQTIRTIIVEYRLPKALTALLAGIALSVSGLQMQTIFRNPLAGPYVLGISSGASLGIAIFVLGFSSFLTAGLFSVVSSWSLAIVAWIGSFLVMLLVLFVSIRVKDIMTILILGMLFTSAASAIVSILQYFSNESMLKAFVIWTLGSLGSVTSSQLGIILPVIIAGLVLAFLKMKDLNAFLLGEDYARSLGVSIIMSRFVIFLSSSLLVGTITAFCGPIGFIGIAVPHISRMLFKTSDHRILLPSVVVTGGIVMLFSDIVSQLPGMQVTLPVNSVTALIGIPIIVWMILKNRKFVAL